MVEDITKRTQADEVTRHSLRPSRLRLRVLLAEDHDVDRLVAVRLLEKRGHTVVSVPDGRQMLARLEEQVFDFALVDVQMPELDGIGATIAIREKEKVTGKHLPIIGLTAYATQDFRERCLAAGMDGYVSKPIQANELFNVIERVIPGFGRL